MSRKRKREVDVELAKVYDELADDQEHKRLKAAHTLLSKVFKSGVTSDDQLKAILNRLFRGLCSSRKSARLGFSVALTELLSQVAGSTEDALSISTSAVIDILEAQTTAEGSISGQDERDHHFGRIFGAEAILKSDILFKRSDPEQWKRLLELLCNVSLKKPWLRQECGWVLYTCLADPTTALPEAFAQDAIQLLITKKLIRTPEGVAIWLTIQRTYPNIDLPKSVWKHGHPLATKDIKTLADILKDAKTQSERGSDEHEAQGSASWSANLHFAWDVVLLKLYQKESEIGGATNGTSKKPSEGTISFQTFWQTAVEGRHQLRNLRWIC
jgi:DNA polymerase phi